MKIMQLSTYLWLKITDPEKALTFHRPNWTTWICFVGVRWF